MKPLDDGQRRERDRLLSDWASLRRGHGRLYGSMFATEGVVFGGLLGLVTGGLWWLGSAVGLAAVALVALLLRLVPAEKRATWSARLSVPRTGRRTERPRSTTVDGISLHDRVKEPYWPQ